jgi:uncharacterized protein (TIGR00369 family)
MSFGTKLLDKIVAGTLEPPPMVRTLHLPQLKGWEPGRVWAEWKVDPGVFHAFGAVFGGYLAALADSALALVMHTTLKDDEIFTTSDLRVSFFRPVTGGILRYEASIVNRGRRMAHVEAVFTDDQGKIAAKATATQVIMPMRDP